MFKAPLRASIVKITVIAALAYAGGLGVIQQTALSMMTEALLIVDEAQADDALLRIGQLVRVMQRLPPRLVIVQGEDRQLATVRHVPGVVAVYEGSVPEAVLQNLGPTERVFAEAWTVGRQAKPQRRGDGLPWDAEGFQPPDAPDDKGNR